MLRQACADGTTDRQGSDHCIPNRNSSVRIACVVLLAGCPAFAQNAPSAGPITCSTPVAAIDSAESLVRRYGKEAKIDDRLSTGLEDMTYKGLVLYPRAPESRIELAFTDDEKMNRVSSVSLIDSKTSRWNVAGVTLGSTLADVQKINGGPFLMREFLTDGGGFVITWKDGVLGRPLPGGCAVAMRFGKGEDMKAPAGDKISSDNVKLRKWGPVVEQITVHFPNK